MLSTIDRLQGAMETTLDHFDQTFQRIIAAQFGPWVENALTGDPAARARVYGVGRDLLEPLIATYQPAAADLAATWYETERSRLGVAGTVYPSVSIPDLGIAGLIGGVLADASTTPGFLQMMLAGAQQRVVQAANSTIMATALRDPHARGWGRAAATNACEFCRLLASRGNVYRTQQTASFAPHFDCHCVAVPVWDSGAAVQVRSREDTLTSRRRMTDKQRARQNAQARAWIAEHRAELGLLA